MKIVSLKNASKPMKITALILLVYTIILFIIMGIRIIFSLPIPLEILVIAMLIDTIAVVTLMLILICQTLKSD